MSVAQAEATERQRRKLMDEAKARALEADAIPDLIQNGDLWEASRLIDALVIEFTQLRSRVDTFAK